MRANLDSLHRGFLMQDFEEKVARVLLLGAAITNRLEVRLGGRN